MSDDYFLDAVSIELFYSTGREGHGKNPVSDVCEIKIIVIILKSISFSANNFSQPVHHEIIFKPNLTFPQIFSMHRNTKY